MQQSLEPLHTYILDKQDVIKQKWIVKTQSMIELDKSEKEISTEEITTTCNEYMKIVEIHLLKTEEDITNKIHEFSQRIVQRGWSLKNISTALMELNRILFEMISFVEDLEDRANLVQSFDKWLISLSSEVLNQYATSWERVVTLQRLALQELSAPLIPVFDNITVLPLIGVIDTERAKRMMENLLFGVVKHRAEVVLIDITGVPIVDTMVAHHIIQAADAVRLVGAKCLIVGIRPEIAQTIVNLGIDLSQVLTKNSLQKGIEYALEITNRQIVTVGE
ncbi:STAS domain-containing protein [Metabacillus malikii]|uniref:RsbT co-antagonist protein RsbR n=1 Tax=Metabacillus malikii TaxID=1504265 RepID=A0ABT9ZMV7_9BACI|nr:STAS domain-containing protein [Metabacillus malikii]MDQ0233605.1 rsbT co-antagonist protein RsbR [Metabacillus malikii]